MKSLVSLLFLLLAVISVTGQKKTVLKPDTIIKEVPMYSKMQADSLQQVYFEMLKSTNEQLNNYWTPVNWFLGALGLLFTVGAIVAGYLIFAQSRDFKKQREQLFEDIRSSANIMIALHEEEFKRIKKEIEVAKSLIEPGNDSAKQALTNIEKFFPNSAFLSTGSLIGALITSSQKIKERIEGEKNNEDKK